MRLRGELDLATGPTLAASLRALCGPGQRVLLDLDDLTFIDMGGLRVVLAAVDDASSDGWAFTITRGSAAVRRLIELVGAESRLPFDGSPR